MIDIEDKMLKARVKLLLQQPLFGQMIMYLQTQDATTWCKTMATDGRKLYYNRDFVERLTMDELVFVHGHEVLHVCLDHFRRGDRIKGVWNMAADFICNAILIAQNVGQMPTGGLSDPRYTDAYSVEEIYDLLIQRCTQVRPTLDMHLDDKDVPDDESGDGDGCFDEQPEGMPVLSQDDLNEARESFRTMLAQTVRNSPPGDVPLGINRFLDRLRKPKINWRQILTNTLRSTIKYDYTFTRLSRRSWSSGLILPGQDVEQKVKATAWLDGSGSTTQEMVTDFLSECKGVFSSFRNFEFTIGTFDTEVYNVMTFTPHNVHEFYRYQFRGGGGTMPSCCWDYMKKTKHKPDKLLIFTDGEVGNDWGDEKYADTVFIIHSNPHIKAPYGKVLHYEKPNKYA